LITRERRRSIVEAIRKVYEKLPKVVRMPDVLKDRRVEVILLPLDEAPKAKSMISRAQNPIDEFLGAWKGEPLHRPEQGEYERREPLE
jgi:hypothetical protein